MPWSHPKLTDAWFTPLADAIPLAGVILPDSGGGPYGNGLPDVPKPPLAGTGAQHYWDVALPKCLSSWDESQIENLIRSAVEVGLPKVRRRFTKVNKVITTSMPLKAVQYDQFWLFYNVTLKNGLETFLFQHPINHNWFVYRFAGVPKITADTNRVVWVTMTWEQLT